MRIATFVDAAHAAFQEAAEAEGTVTRHYEVGGAPVRVRYAGGAVAAEFDRSLLPLASDAAPAAALDIVAWDSATTGVPMPAPPWDRDAYLPRDRIRGVDSTELRIAYSPQVAMLLMHETGAARALFHIRDVARIPHWVKRVPFRQLFGWWSGDRDMDFVHASGVGLDGRCVLLAGASGSGKSTTALACAERGLAFLGDDLCLVDATAAPPVAHAVYGVAKLEAAAAERLPRLAARAISVDDGQALVAPERRLSKATVVAVLLPVVTGGPVRLEPVTASEALFALAPSTLIEPNGATPGSLARLARLVRAVPCLRLELGPDLDEVATVVRTALDGRG